MPLHYGSQVAEHHAVRTGAGVFDVSHMTVIDIAGPGAKAFLRLMLAGDVARLTAIGQAMYTTLLNETGGIVDDLIAYRMPEGYRLVVNASTRAKVLDWLGRQLDGIRHQLPVPAADVDTSRRRGDASSAPGTPPRVARLKAPGRFDVLSSTPASPAAPHARPGESFDVLVTEVGDGGGPAGEVTIRERELAILAVQGPQAIAICAGIGRMRSAESLGRFNAVTVDGWTIARTGYTGEDGLEIMLPNKEAPALWRQLLAAGVRPAGLAARDTLRLEAGLNLYGQDMNESVSPLAANLGWTVHWLPEDRDFIGRRALERERSAGAASKLTGLALTVKGVMRRGQRVLTEAGEGTVTSGLFSPTLGYSIALARLPAQASHAADVLIRDRRRRARIVRPPFVRTG